MFMGLVLGSEKYQFITWDADFHNLIVRSDNTETQRSHLGQHAQQSLDKEHITYLTSESSTRRNQHQVGQLHPTLF